MPSLNANAYVSVKQLRIYLTGDQFTELGSTGVGATVSGSYVQAINQASQVVDNFFGYTLFSGSSFTEIFNGKGYNQTYNWNHDTIKVQRNPLVGSPRLYKRNGTAWDALTEAYTWDTNTGEIYFTDQSIFDAGFRNYKVVYEWGFTNIDTVDYSIKLAVSMIAQDILTSGQNGQALTLSIGDHAVSRSTKVLREEAMRILQMYKDKWSIN